MRPVFFLFGALSLALGTLGIFLPLLPTVPLVLLAAFCFARSSPKLHNWLVSHRVFGPQIKDWNDHGAIHPRAKKMASATIALALCLSIAMSVPVWVLATQVVVLTCVLIFIWTRPSS